LATTRVRRFGPRPAGARALSLTATVQEAHQVALHLICLSFDATALASDTMAVASGDAVPAGEAVPWSVLTPGRQAASA
jgi:hypothetical protein